MSNLNTTLPTAMPLTMSSLEIAGLTGKRHDHVIRDIRKMLADLGAPSPQFWGKVIGKGRPMDVANLPQRETLILVSGYSVEMRARIIDRWRELEIAMAGNHGPVTVAALDSEVRKIMGGIVKNVIHAEITTAITAAIPMMVQAALAAQSYSLRKGKTAGQIWKDHGFPMVRAGAWFGNRLAQASCRIDGHGCGELGSVKARLFDPDRAEQWLRNGGRLMVEHKIAEARGQRVIPFPRVVQPAPVSQPSA